MINSSPSAAAAVFSIALLSCGPSKDKMKASFTESCSINLLPSFTDTVRREAAQHYCECAGNAVVTRLTEKELRIVTRMQQNGQDTAAIELLQPILQPCHDSLMMAIETASLIAPPSP